MEQKSSNNQASAPQMSNGIAIAAMVVGIIAILLSFVPFAGLTLGATAIVLGIIGLKKAASKGMSIAGLITGGLASLSNLVIIIMIFMGLTFLGGLFGGAVSTVGQITNDLHDEAQAQIDAKKDFSKGSTAVFGDFEVKANSVQRNYVPEEEYYQAGEGKELIVVNVSVKNISSETTSFSSYDLDINDDGISEGSSYLTVSPEFTGGSMSAGATATGNLVFEVTENASGLKLQYEDYTFNWEDSESVTLTYTLEI